MKAIRNILAGFLVSFVGSIPLGYLNIAGYEIYRKSGTASLVPYLLGVLCIECIVIYTTLLFAQSLAANKKLLKAIELFSIFFIVLLAAVFYISSDSKSAGGSALTKYIGYPPFAIGIILSCFNFVQIPFWTGWNLYLINGKYINANGPIRYLYLFGTLAGTFFGMLTLVLFLGFLTGDSNNWSKYLMSRIIPLVFLAMGIYQSFKFWRKYYHAHDSEE